MIIGGNDRLSDVIAETSVKIDSFNQQALLNLKSVNEASGKTCFSDEEIDNGLTAKENKDEYTVYYTYNGSTFGKQTIQKGAKASKPSLMPTKKGSWDTNFDNPVERDTTIPWIEEKEESGSD